MERCTNRGNFALSISKFEKAVFFDEINDYVIMVLLLMIFISVVYLKILLKQPEATHYYSIIDVEDQTGNVYFNYISIYLLSCLGLTLSSIADVFVLLFLMLIVGYIYISNHMTYMNPLLQLLGFKIYEGTIHSDSTNKDFQSVIIAPKRLALQNNKTYSGSGKEDFIFLSHAQV